MWDRFLNWVGDQIILIRQWQYRRDMMRARGYGFILPDLHTILLLFRPLALVQVARENSGNLAVLGLVAIIATGGLRAAGSVWAQPKPAAQTPGIRSVYYYDLGNGAIYVAPSNSPTPMVAPTKKPGPNGTEGGVRAYVFACGTCDDPATRFLGYIETIDPLSLAPPTLDGEAPAAPPPHTRHVLALGRVIAKPEPDLRWISPTGEEGLALVYQLKKRCGDQPLRSCTP